MRLKFIYGFLAFVAAVVFAACNASDQVSNANKKPITQATETVYADGARRITIEELEAMIQDGTAFVVDVRNQSAYDVGHIPGARLIPSSEILAHVNELPHDKLIVTYCS